VPSPSSPPTSNNVSLGWRAPATRVDGSVIDSLVGFRVYYGTTYLNLPRTWIEVNNPSAVTWTITGLAQGTWYFAVTAIDRDSRESSFSSIVSMTFP
jgi:hypothetical protein